MSTNPGARRPSRSPRGLARRSALLALGPLALWFGIVAGSHAGGAGPTTDWTQPLVIVAGWALCAWGAWWSLCCGLAAVARMWRVLSGETPAWAARLPRRCLAAAGLAAGAALTTLVPAHASTAPSAVVAYDFPGPTDSDGEPLTATWPVESAPEQAPGTKADRPEHTPVATPRTRPATDGSPTAASSAWSAPKRSTRLPSALGAPVRHHVTVRPGDSLWSLAAQHLGGSASDHDIAEEWPRWYRANREAIGPDPNLLIPGTTLLPPAV